MFVSREYCDKKIEINKCFQHYYQKSCENFKPIKKKSLSVVSSDIKKLAENNVICSSRFYLSQNV